MLRTNVQNEGIIRLDKGIGKIVQQTNVQNEGIIRFDKGIGKIVLRTNVQMGSILFQLKKKCTMEKTKKEGMKYEETHNIITILQWRGRTKKYTHKTTTTKTYGVCLCVCVLAVPVIWLVF